MSRKRAARSTLTSPAKASPRLYGPRGRPGSRSAPSVRTTAFSSRGRPQPELTRSATAIPSPHQPLPRELVSDSVASCCQTLPDDSDCVMACTSEQEERSVVIRVKSYSAPWRSRYREAETRTMSGSACSKPLLAGIFFKGRPSRWPHLPHMAGPGVNLHPYRRRAFKGRTTPLRAGGTGCAMTSFVSYPTTSWSRVKPTNSSLSAPDSRGTRRGARLQERAGRQRSYSASREQRRFRRSRATQHVQVERYDSHRQRRDLRSRSAGELSSRGEGDSGRSRHRARASHRIPRPRLS